MAMRRCGGTTTGNMPRNRNWPPTLPHHKHVPPDLREILQPAPGFSLDAPNLPVVLKEVWRECAPRD